MATLLPEGKQSFTDAAGKPLVGGKVYTYDAGTSSPRPTYQDAAGTIPNTNPVVLDARGEATIFWSGAYKVVLKDALDNTVWTVDNVISADTYAATVDTSLRADIGDSVNPNKGLGLLMYNVALSYPVGSAGEKFQERLSLLDFIPKSQHAAIRNFTSVYDATAAILSFFAALNGREGFVPAGKYNHTALTYSKTLRFHLYGEFNGYDPALGAVFNCTASGTGIGFQIGVDDGNPDATGPIRDVRVSGIHFTTSAALGTAIRVQNTAMCELRGNSIRNYTGKIIDCRANVLLKIRDNDVAGVNNGTGCYAVWLDDEYFGNFVTEITGNHLYQCNWVIRASEGRSLTVHGNTFENIKNGTGTGGVVKLETAGYISELRFTNNYVESQQGWVFEASTFTGAVLFFVLRDNEFWGSGDAANVNPGFGNIPRNKVFNQDIRGNFVVDSNWNTKAFLALPSVYPTTSVFDQTTTIIKDPVTNKEYEEAIRYALSTSEMLLQAGDFCMVTGGVAGTMTITGAGATPAFWTNLAVPQWQLVPDTISGTWCCFVPGGGDFDRCSRVINLTPVNRTRYFAIGFTTKGWSALRVDGTSVYDSGASVANWHTDVVTFTVAPNAASFTLKFGTNAGNTFYIGEARLYEIGAAEANEPGTMNNAIIKAVKSLMKRGAH